MLECDVFVIGFGPAGASLAWYLAQKNIKVIVAEKKKSLDTPVRCAGFVPVNIAGLFDFKISGINNRSEYLETYVAENPFEKFHLISKISAPGFILDRDIFINDIASRFANSGGKLLKGTKVISAQHGPGGFTLDLLDMASKNHLKAKARIIAGADGPLSLIGRLTGSANKSFMPAIQQNPSTISKSSDCSKVFFSPYISCGYGWLFPKAGSINLGVGAYFKHKTAQTAITGISIKDTLALFTRHLEFSGIISGYANQQKAVTGLIPDSGIVENPSFKDGFILCGDAAGLCNPVTGAGIYNAIYSAKLASEIIIKSLILKDLGSLLEIKEIYNNQFGNSISRALEKKLLQKNNWPQSFPDMNNLPGLTPNAHNRPFYDYKYSKDNIEFLDLIRQTWISFRDYWH